MAYYAKKRLSDNVYLERKCGLVIPENTEGFEWEEIISPDAVEIYQETVVIYDADELISWALQQVFAESLIPHMAAFLDFANKATEVSKANFLAYASAVGLTTTANTIITKAIELGADLE